jgi:hypothetical protein
LADLAHRHRRTEHGGGDDRLFYVSRYEDCTVSCRTERRRRVKSWPECAIALILWPQPATKISSGELSGPSGSSKMPRRREG